MKDFKIQVNEPDNYQKRSNSSFIIIVIVSVVIAVVAGYKSGWNYGVGFGVLIFIVQYFKAYQSAKSYVVSVAIDAGKVELLYFDRDEKKTIKDEIGLFDFKKTSGFSKTRIIYLAIIYKGDQIVKQAVSSEWTEAKFDQIIEAFARLKV